MGTSLTGGIAGDSQRNRSRDTGSGGCHGTGFGRGNHSRSRSFAECCGDDILLAGGSDWSLEPDHRAAIFGAGGDGNNTDPFRRNAHYAAAAEGHLFSRLTGPTRTERTPPAPPGLAAASSAPTVMNIEDSVAGYRYSFDTNSHAAHRTPIAPIRVTKGEVAAPTSSNAVQGASTATSGRFQAAGANASQPRPEISNEQLGTQTMEGVLGDGVRTTTTWPVGFFGNDRPVSSIRETWSSRELGMAVLSKSSDPRYGETTTKVTNIQRAEPDPSLFQPPAGYEIVDPQVTQQR